MMIGYVHMPEKPLYHRFEGWLTLKGNHGNFPVAQRVPPMWRGPPSTLKHPYFLLLKQGRNIVTSRWSAHRAFGAAGAAIMPVMDRRP